MSETLDIERRVALTQEGARMRMVGRPRDSCPYPLNSLEREAWMEGFDGQPADPAIDRSPDSA